MKINGTREEVWDNHATKTRGGLKKKDLLKTSSGKIISKKVSALSKNRYKKNKLMLNHKKHTANTKTERII